MHLEGYGCAGASAVAYGLACLELEAGDSRLRSFVSVQGSLAMFAIWKWGSEEQKQQWLPRMAAGEAIGCFGLTEPDAGSDPGAMRTRARRDGDDWVLTARRCGSPTARSPTSRWCGRRPTTASAASSSPRGTPGFTTPDIKHKISLRASITSELVLDDVRAARPTRCCPRCAACAGPLSCLNEARYGIVWGAVGAGRACYEAALEYAEDADRSSASRSAAFQLQQQKLAEMAIEVNRGDARRAAPRPPQGRRAGCGPSTSRMGKFGNVRGALEVARTARTVLGANGITLEYPVIRHMNNLESVYTYEGTHDVHALVIGGARDGHPGVPLMRAASTGRSRQP